MKQIILLSAAFAAFTVANAQDVINIEFVSNQYYQTDFGGGEYYTTITIGSDYRFNFDIFSQDDGLVSGHIYTLDDMDTEFSNGIDYILYQDVYYSSAEYVEYQHEDGSKDIEATVISTEGQTYHLTGSWAPSDEPDMAKMPEGIATISCVLSYKDKEEGERTFESRLAFDGNDVYLEGCCYISNFFKSIIKGTRNADGSLVFPMGQCVGYGSTGNYFIYGFLMDTFVAQDITFTYNDQLEAYECTSDIYVNTGMSDYPNNYYEYFSDIVLTPNEPVAIQQVEAASAATTIKAMHDGSIMIHSNGRTYNAVGLRIK